MKPSIFDYIAIVILHPWVEGFGRKPWQILLRVICMVLELFLMQCTITVALCAFEYYTAEAIFTTVSWAALFIAAFIVKLYDK